LKRKEKVDSMREKLDGMIEARKEMAEKNLVAKMELAKKNNLEKYETHIEEMEAHKTVFGKCRLTLGERNLKKGHRSK
jgi:hypothetical protein